MSDGRINGNILAGRGSIVERPLVRGALIALMIALVLVGMSGAQVGAQGQKVAVFGADLTAAERQELTQLFGIDPGAQAQTVNAQELVAALGNSGLPVATTDRSISSSVLTCLNRGDGLNVRTQNITRIPASVYADALVTAGVGDGNVLVAAPVANPVTGETALVGVLKAFPQCQGAQQPDPARVNLAYEQVARTTTLAGPGELDRAGATLLAAGQAVLTGKLTDDAAVGAELDRAAAAQGLPLDPAQRAATIDFLKRRAAVDYGTYAQGYQVEQINPNEVRVTPAGAGAPAAGAQPGAAGTTFSGDVTAAAPGAPLTVRDTGGQNRQVAASTGVVVIRDGRPATVADIRPTDRVNVTLGPDGAATRIEAASQAPGAAAGAQPTAAATSAPSPAAGTTFSGDVTRTGTPLTVRETGGAERTVRPAPNVTVIRDGRPATVGDIQTTDRVNVSVAPDGTATRIEATSQAAPAATNERGFNPLWLLPLLLLPLLLIPFLLGRRRKRDSFILERDTVRATRVTEDGDAVTTTTTTEAVTSDETADRSTRPRR